MSTKEQDFCRDVICYFKSLGYKIKTSTLISYTYSNYYDYYVFFIHISFFKNYVKTNGHVYYTNDINYNETIFNKWTKNGSYITSKQYDDYFFEHLEPFLKKHKIDKTLIKFTKQ